jgi:hypothetical protein
MRAILWFGAALLVIVAVCGLLLAIPFSSKVERTAIEVSAAVAVVVQMFAFSVARFVSKPNYLAGWIIGVVLRFVTLIAYGVVAVKLFGMPAPAALLSLVTFLFASTLVEPKLLTL